MDQHHIEERTTVRELQDSLLLLGLAATSLTAYMGLAFAVVKVFAAH